MLAAATASMIAVDLRVVVLPDLPDTDDACPNASTRATMCQDTCPGAERQRTPNTPEDYWSARDTYPPWGRRREAGCCDTIMSVPGEVGTR